MMRESEWIDAARYLSRVWPSRPVGPETAETWYPALRGYPAEDVFAALQRLAVSHSRPPSLADIVEAIEGAEDDGWLPALGELRRLIARSGGIYCRERPTPDDPALAAVIDSLGWRTVCNLDPSSSSDRAQFRDAYRAAARRHVREGGSRALPSADTPEEIPDGRP